MICLCVETATSRVGAALTSDGRLLAESLLDAPGGRQNGLLMPELLRLLDQNDLSTNQIDLFACATGPGSFTGVRTGIAAIQGLALASGKPCIGVSTLAMLAMNLPHAAWPVCPMLDARKNEVYTGLYQVTNVPTLLKDDCVRSPAEFIKTITSPTIFVGDGALRYHDLILETVGTNAIFAPQLFHILRPAAGCLLAEAAFQNGLSVPPEQLLPTYLRLSEAELSRQQKI
ncbi:MAG: tRNA (adenosine(37)-N6)-threonylcarbamoyltransferase complex dimerization subunit type 1 TsaB [Geobacter sp.]|nr:tRNA (adenosine(37)-N6)-threonylcarbamoyltransferase complex dimerization subunit type 1 TsaB [Geobacter sp.]